MYSVKEVGDTQVVGGPRAVAGAGAMAGLSLGASGGGYGVGIGYWGHRGIYRSGEGGGKKVHNKKLQSLSL